jgi:hypothetical protein
MTDRGLTTGLPRARTAAPAEEPIKHVIAEYRHATETVTCVCGWLGSSATTDGRNSPWSLHVAANRPPRR